MAGSFTVNTSTISHIARLIMSESRNVYNDIMCNAHTIRGLRPVVVRLADKIEKEIFAAVKDCKQVMFDDPDVEISKQEVYILRSLISSMSILCAFLIFYSITFLKRLMTNVIKHLSMDSLFSGFYLCGPEYDENETFIPKSECKVMTITIDSSKWGQRLGHIKR